MIKRSDTIAVGGNTHVAISNDNIDINITLKKPIDIQCVASALCDMVELLVDEDIRSQEKNADILREKIKNFEPTDITPVSQPKPVQKRDDEFKVRDRLPNQIDLKDYKITSAKKKEVLLRCPNCGQGHCVMTRVNNTNYFLEKLNDKFEITGEADGPFPIFVETYGKKEDETSKDYYDKMQQCEIIESNDFACSDEMDMFCPVCKVSRAMKDWVNTYNNPMNIFGFNNVCDACGAEMVAIPGEDGRVCMFCENDSCRNSYLVEDK